MRLAYRLISRKALEQVALRAGRRRALYPTRLIHAIDTEHKYDLFCWEMLLDFDKRVDNYEVYYDNRQLDERHEPC